MLKLLHIQDFYVLDLLLKMAKEKHVETISHSGEKLISDIEDAYDSLTESLAPALYTYLYMASMGESRWASYFNKWYFIKGHFGEHEREDIYQIALGVNPQKALPILHQLFDDGQWSHGNYGGKKWAKIVEGAMEYGKIPPKVFIDRVIDLQHNSGTAFSKKNTVEYTKFDVSFLGLDTWLYNKTNANILSEFFVQVTPKTKSLVNRIIPNNQLAPTLDTWTGWNMPEFGNKELTIVKKISAGRYVKKESDNSISAEEVREKITQKMNELLTPEYKFAIAFANNEIKKALVKEAETKFKAKAKYLAQTWGTAYPKSVFKQSYKWSLDKIKGGDVPLKFSSIG